MNGKEKREEKYSADNKINNITARKLMAAVSSSIFAELKSKRNNARQKWRSETRFPFPNGGGWK